jgi:hypothetical protein
MRRGRRQPSQSWKAFLRNHATGIAAMDLLVVPRIGFRLLAAVSRPDDGPNSDLLEHPDPSEPRPIVRRLDFADEFGGAMAAD